MLTDSIIQKAEPMIKQYKISDGDRKGLSLLVSPNGSKHWRYRYRFNGKAKMISLGAYPDVSLNEARRRLAEARETRTIGIDPSKKRQALRREKIIDQGNTFDILAREWHEKKKAKWKPKYAAEVLRRLESNLFPSLGSRPIKDITALELLEALRKVEDRGALSVAKRGCQMAGEIFRYAVVTGRAERDVAADIKGGLQSLPPVKHRNHVESHELRQFMLNLKQHKCKLLTKLALRLLLLTFVRSSELREATWDEICWEKKQWIISGGRMKMKRKHLVPLSRQALDVLTRIKKISGHTPMLFPGSTNPKKAMGNNILLHELYRMGYYGEATIHGFRSTASTDLNEMEFDERYIEMQLAHVEPNPVKKAYNFAKYLPARQKMMQHWADYLEAIGQEGNKMTPTDFMFRQ